MDPITHGIAGALIGTAFFGGSRDGRAANGVQRKEGRSKDLPLQTAQAALSPTAVVALGALFPDADFAFHFFSSSRVATLEYHRWITHSLICLPVFAVALAAGAQWVTRKWTELRSGAEKQKAESRKQKAGALGLRQSAADAAAGGREEGEPQNRLAELWRWTLWFGVGIASHIFLDVITSWGTMTLSPVSHVRPAWDWVFIIDGALTALVLLPHLLAWINRDSRAAWKRAVIAWLGVSAGAFGLQQMCRVAGVPFSGDALGVVIATLGLALFVPVIAGMGARVQRVTWHRAGLALVCVYLLACALAQRAALARVQEFAQREGLAVQRVGALPLPPSSLRWAGLVRTSAGVYRTMFSLTDEEAPRFEFVADRATPETIEAATKLPEVQTYLWFARFPVVEVREVAGQQVAIFSDERFVQRLAAAPAPFEYWVVFDTRGNVVRHGWAGLMR